MKFCALTIFALFYHLSDGYIFTERPDAVVWGIEGEPLELQCAVDESWQVYFLKIVMTCGLSRCIN